MSYKLNKPYNEKQKANFIVIYNHNMGLRIEESTTALYALEAWETLENDIVIDDKEQWEKEQAKKERERINNLFFTRGDVFEAFILAKGLGQAQIRTMIEAYEGLSQTEKAIFLNRFDNALNFYRGYPIFDLLGQMIGITPEMFDNYFIKGSDEETKADAWKELLPPVVEESTTEQNAEVEEKSEIPINPTGDELSPTETEEIENAQEINTKDSEVVQDDI